MTIGRTDFLKLSWEDQKKTDLRAVLDPSAVGPAASNLKANCINPRHQDDTASMEIYSNAAYCFGCKSRWWPDVFLKDLGDRPLATERSYSSKYPTPKYIPFSVVDTYKRWLWGSTPDGFYRERQKWLLDRGLSREICTQNYIGHTGEAYTIPIFSAGYDVQSIRYRRDDELASEDRPKYWGTSGANKAMLYVPRRVLGTQFRLVYGVILCEGELDALRLAQEGYPAVSLTNGCNSIGVDHMDALENLCSQLGTARLTVAYDQDQPGREASNRAVELLRVYTSLGVRQAVWHIANGKDVTEFLKAKPAALPYSLVEAWA